MGKKRVALKDTMRVGEANITNESSAAKAKITIPPLHISNLV